MYVWVRRSRILRKQILPGAADGIAGLLGSKLETAISDRTAGGSDGSVFTAALARLARKVCQTLELQRLFRNILRHHNPQHVREPTA